MTHATANLMRIRNESQPISVLRAEMPSNAVRRSAQISAAVKAVSSGHGYGRALSCRTMCHSYLQRFYLNFIAGSVKIGTKVMVRNDKQRGIVDA